MEKLNKMAPTRVILMSCGSYNPPTDMHLRMFELARDHLHRMGTHEVVGAVISPTHDDYAKKELASAEHRCAMLKLATQNSDWIKVSNWEIRQNGWTKTRLSLQHHQNLLNSLLLDTNDIKCCIDVEDMDWIPEKLKNTTDLTPIQIKLLCGADLLESFGTPGLWAEEDIDAIVGQHGLVVITREGSNPHKFIYESDTLSKYMHNIQIVINWIRHEVSSTKIRKAFRRGDSVKYEIQDSVIEYVYKHGLYGAKTVTTIKLELSSNNGNDYLNIEPKYQSAFLTPSPSDITMTTPSPVELISIDISESVLKRNYQNSPSFSKSQTSSCLEDTERMREKFINVITDNGNKLLASNKVAYPGQAKQIIATETGESQIFCEVGLSSISEKYKNDIDGEIYRRTIDDNVVLDIPCKIYDCQFVKEEIITSNDPSPSDALETLRSSDLTPDNSDSKVSVVLALDTPDASSLDYHDETIKPSFKSNSDEKIAHIETANSLEMERTKEFKETECPSSIILKPSTSRSNDDYSTSENPSEDRDDMTEIDKSQGEKKQSKEKSKSNLTSGVKRIVQCQHKREIIFQIKSKNIEETQKPIIVEESTIEDANKTTEETKSPAEIKLSQSEANVEIDGKYIKSLVNLRKSPKKVNEEEKVGASSCSILEAADEESSRKVLSSVSKDVDGQSMNPLRCEKSNGRRRGVLFQGSLDSINVTQPKTSMIGSRHPPISKKAKSYELIKLTDVQPTTIYKMPSIDLKSDPESSSIFMTANETNEAQTDEFCSVCCYANDPSSTEVFLTLRSTASSPLEEDSTECDICSNCDLQENGEEADFKAVTTTETVDSVCELCEICGDRAIEEDVVASLLPEKDDFVDRRLLASRALPLSLPKNKKGVGLDSQTFNDSDEEKQNLDDKNPQISDNRDKILTSNFIDELSTDNTNSNDDEFEIENCGSDVNFEKNESNSRYKSEVEDTFRHFVPRDEVAMSGKSANKMIRAGSLVTRDTVDRSKAKRRYSSVDNLQNSRKIVRTTSEKQNSMRSRGTVKGLMASADNIRPVRTSRSRSLRKSADDVGRGSSMDDMQEDPLYENIQRKKWDGKDDDKSSDSGTIKMILTKHGIKIISDKETAL